MLNYFAYCKVSYFYSQKAKSSGFSFSKSYKFNMKYKVFFECFHL